MPDDSSPNTPPTIRARRWSRPQSSTPRRLGSRSFGLRLIGIPIVAVIGVFLYTGIRDRLALPECDSDRAKHTLADVLKQLQIEPTRYEPIKTVSATKEQNVCNATLPLAGGGDVTIDFTFYWEGGKANMKYSIARKSS